MRTSTTINRFLIAILHHHLKNAFFFFFRQFTFSPFLFGLLFPFLFGLLFHFLFRLSFLWTFISFFFVNCEILNRSKNSSTILIKNELNFWHFMIWFTSRPSRIKYIHSSPRQLAGEKKSYSYNHKTTIWVSHEYYLNPEFHKILSIAFWVIAILRFSPYGARVDFKGLISK